MINLTKEDEEGHPKTKQIETDRLLEDPASFFYAETTHMFMGSGHLKVTIGNKIWGA